MVEVVVLGSGTPNPDPARAGAAVAVVDGSAWVMIDCGRGATQRALAAGLDLAEVVAVLITHHHSDHLSDLATLAITRWTAGASAPRPRLLVLTHMIPAPTTDDDERAYLDEVRDGGFTGPTVVAHDLLRLPISE